MPSKAQPSHDYIIVSYFNINQGYLIGGMNAKVAGDNTNYERAMGREGCGSTNENGERLLYLL